MTSSASAATQRLDHLDAVRAFALLLGIVFHASLSFLSNFIGWAVMDLSTSRFVDVFALISHAFRMELFFLIAGFFSHLSFHRKGPGNFLRSRFIQVGLPFLLGWFLLRPLVVSDWIIGGASMRGEADVLGGLREAFMLLRGLPQDIFTGTHLWFLYYLLLITAVALILRAVIKAGGPLAQPVLRAADAAVEWIATRPLAVYLLALPTAWAVWSMQQWGMATPDRSLTPYGSVLCVYGGFFGLGWMLRRNDQLVAFSRLTASRWIVTAVSIAAVLWLARFQADPGHPRHDQARAVQALAYAIMMWSLVVITLGLFQRYVRRGSPLVRYVADSSYWMYLIHLPIVLWLQITVAELPGHWSLKLAGVSIATIAICLLSYDLFVRSTILGRILNGRRRERALFRRSGASASLCRDAACRHAAPASQPSVSQRRADKRQPYTVE